MAVGFERRLVASPELGEHTPSLMLGEVGVRAVARVGLDRIYELVEANIEHAGEMPSLAYL